MNGRIYSPSIGRMLSPDPVTQAPENGQNYNRYSYAFNNPLKYTDPSGYATRITGNKTTSEIDHGSDSGGSAGGVTFMFGDFGVSTDGDLASMESRFGGSGSPKVESGDFGELGSSHTEQGITFTIMSEGLEDWARLFLASLTKGDYQNGIFSRLNEGSEMTVRIWAADFGDSRHASVPMYYSTSSGLVVDTSRFATVGDDLTKQWMIGHELVHVVDHTLGLLGTAQSGAEANRQKWESEARAYGWQQRNASLFNRSLDTKSLYQQKAFAAGKCAEAKVDECTGLYSGL